ncbi:MAG: alpha/beta fold hydrolase [Gemmatimonadaceae bacterium]
MSSPPAHVHRLPDGRAMGYAEFGQAGGRPLIFCHGFPSSRLAGQLLDAEARALGVRVIVPDRPGHGLSDFTRRRRVVQWADDVASLAAALRLDKFALLGLSVGGAYAAACAALLTDRVTSAGIASGWAPPGAPKSKPGARLPFLPALGRSVRLLRRFSLSRAARRIAKDGARFVEKSTSYAPPADRAVLADASFRRVLVDDMREAFRQGARGPAREARVLNRRWGFRLEDIRIPVWIWHGHEDRNVPPALARFVAERIPGSRTTFFRAEGHVSTLVNHVGEILQAVSGL